jgi:nucleotide-binding universal stress UspA family protein
MVIIQRIPRDQMKTILTFVGGGERDEVILQTALAAAIPLSAHLDCLHAHVPSALAARHAKLDYAMGDALKNALDRLRADSDSFSRIATKNVRAFCSSAGIEMCDGLTDAPNVTASFFEEPSNELACLSSHASRRDFVVMGRARQKQGLAPDSLEHIVRNSGRPVLTAGTAAPRTLTDTIMVCWKDVASTTAAVIDAAPLLAKARRVVFVSVAKRDGGLAACMAATARAVAGIEAEVHVIPARRGGIPEALAVAAEECEANLLVMGAYGRSRGREILFGSCTDKLLARSDRPILLRH